MGEGVIRMSAFVRKWRLRSGFGFLYRGVRWVYF